MYTYFASPAHCIFWPWLKVTRTAYYSGTVILWFIDFHSERGKTHIHTLARHPPHSTQYALTDAHISSAVIWFLRRHDANPINSGWGSIEKHFHERKLLLDFDSVSSAAAVVWRWLRNESYKGAPQCLMTFFHIPPFWCVFTRTASACQSKPVQRI